MIEEILKSILTSYAIILLISILISIGENNFFFSFRKILFTETTIRTFVLWLSIFVIVISYYFMLPKSKHKCLNIKIKPELTLNINRKSEIKYEEESKKYYPIIGNEIHK